MNEHGPASDRQGLERTAARAGLHPLRVPWRHKYLVLLGLAAGLGLGGLYYTQATPLYEAKAQVLVVKKHPDEVTGMDTRRLEVEDHVATQREILRSQLILERAIRKAGLDSFRSFTETEPQSLTETLTRSLQITRNKGPTGYNNVLNLSLAIADPQEAADALNAIIESYKDFLDETYHSMSDSTLSLVKKARDDVLQELRQKETAYRGFRDKSPLIRTAKEREGQAQDRLRGIESRTVSLLLWRAEIQGQLSALENARKEGLSREATLALMASLSHRTESEGTRREPMATSQDQLASLLAEEQKLAASYGPNYPRLKAVRKEIETLRVVYASPSAPWSVAKRQDGKDSSTDPVEEHVLYLRQQLKYVENAHRLLTDLYEREHEAAKKIDRYEMQEEAFRTDIGRLNDLYDGIIKQLQNVRLVRDVGGYEAQVINRPALGKKVSPKGLLIFPAAALLGLVLGCGLAFLADWRDGSLRTAEDVRRLGLPVLGCIPRLPRNEPAAGRTAGAGRILDPRLLTYHRPHSLESEAYRAVRTALFFSGRGRQHRVLQITSPNAGDGKSTLAANLAVSIAQAGRTVLLIDAELRKPRLHQLFGIPAERGLADLITSDSPLDPPEVIQGSEVPNLWILPSGPVPSHPAELLTSRRFEDVLELLRTQYDFVLLDTAPLLAVSDPSAVAPRVDGVLLVLRLTKDGRSAAERATEILSTVGAAIVGAVVNGTSRDWGLPTGYDSDASRVLASDEQAVPDVQKIART